MGASRGDRAAFWAARTAVLVVVSVVVLVLGVGLDGRDRVIARSIGAVGLMTSVVVALLWRRGRL